MSAAAEWIADQKARLPFAEWRDTADLLTDHHRALDALDAVLEVVRLHRREPATDGSVDEYDYVGELADEIERAIETELRGES